MDKALATALGPFALFLILLAARPFVAWVWRKLPDGRLRRFLFIRW